jgi:tRNA G18 (ribose-2'-O)-methylase SpoU
MNLQAQYKRLAGILRNYMLRLGKHWERAPLLYDQQIAALGLGAEYRLAGNTQHKRVLELYLHFRHAAGLEQERDVYFEAEDGDREAATAPPIPYAVLAHNLRSAYNVGSLFRTCDCFGFEAVYLSGYTPGPDHPALRSAARGAQNWVRNERWEAPVERICALKQKGYTVLALETGPGSVPIHEANWPRKGLVLVGNEELGIAPELLEHCDIKIEIPMFGRKASLNVASAFAVLGFSVKLSEP